MKRSAHELATLMRLLDEALELPEAERDRWVEGLGAEHAPLRDTLRGLLSQAGAPETREFAGMQQHIAGIVDDGLRGGEAEPGPGARVGPYRLERELGQGGMGSVWLAQRADGAFARTVALKLPRMVWMEDLAARMARERDILASLQHEHIARFYDAGVDQAGRPYIAMEYVQGVPIDEYCRARALSVGDILALVLQVCRALAHAHSRLIVHRDLKPGNILVSEEQGVRLVDFGIAALLSEEPGAPVTQFAGRMLTLDYSSPEQLRGEPIGTPSDVYSLAVVCYELLTRRRPYELVRGSIAQAAKAIVEIEPRPASEVADADRRARLRGDLDAVLHKALKKNPAERYASMAELADDIERHLRQIPVRARPDRFHYRARRFLARYRWQAGAAALVFAAVLAGGGAALWQAHAARLEAQRADVIKNFLLDILRTNDVRVAGDDGPRTERTVKQVLDTAATRVEEQFAGQPQTQVELLGLIAVIYENYGEMDRYRDLESRRAELARKYFGPGHPEVIRGLLLAADAAVAHREFGAADRLLAAADEEIRAARREDAELRAGWLRVKARRLARTGETAERARLTEQSVALYRRAGRPSTDFAAALSMLARVRADQARGPEALALMREGVQVAESAEVPDDAFLSGEYLNFARQLEQSGKAGEAHEVYRRAQGLAARTWGKQSRNYWMALAWDARLLQFTGDRPGARPLLAELGANLPADLDDYNVHMAREAYADCLARDGRAAEAVPLLEAAERHYLEHSSNDFDVREVRLTLGDAYDLAGRSPEARDRLKAARDEYVAKERPGSRWGLRARERWARFLADHGVPGSTDLVVAESELKALIADAGDQSLPWVARAHADLAQVALARGQPAAALAASQRALAELARVSAVYDVRMQPRLWLIHGEALLASGDAAGARDWARKARAASLQYEEATSPAIAAADDTLQRASRALGERG